MRNPAGTVIVSLLSVLALGLLTGCPAFVEETPTQPAPKTSGPGSTATTNGDFSAKEFLSGAQKYFLYQPTDPTPSEPVPIVVFLHGYGGVNPRAYGDWIEHLVLRGNIVVYPVYQETLQDGQEYTDNAIAAIEDALSRLGTDGNAAGDTDQLVFVGHSLGTTISFNIAALAAQRGLPIPRALMLTNPGDADTVIGDLPSIQQGDYADISADTLLVIVVGADDTLAGSAYGISLYDSVPQIPESNRTVIELQSDSYGDPNLISGHFAPLSINSAFDSGDALLNGGTIVEPSTETLDVLDYNGYWKWLDALMNLAFDGTDRKFVFGDTSDQTSLGSWSDGTAIERAVVLRP